MAKRTLRKPVRAARSRILISQIQKSIGDNFVSQAREYKTIFVALWDMPTTRFFVGGFAFAAFVPRSFKGMSWVSNAVSDKIDERRFTGKLENLKKHFAHVGDEISI